MKTTIEDWIIKYFNEETEEKISDYGLSGTNLSKKIFEWIESQEWKVTNKTKLVKYLQEKMNISNVYYQLVKVLTYSDSLPINWQERKECLFIQAKDKGGKNSPIIWNGKDIIKKPGHIWSIPEHINPDFNFKFEPDVGPHGNWAKGGTVIDGFIRHFVQKKYQNIEKYAPFLAIEAFGCLLFHKDKSSTVAGHTSKVDVNVSGPPASGKSIFGDAVSSVLDCSGIKVVGMADYTTAGVRRHIAPLVGEEEGFEPAGAIVIDEGGTIHDRMDSQYRDNIDNLKRITQNPPTSPSGSQSIELKDEEYRIRAWPSWHISHPGYSEHQLKGFLHSGTSRREFFIYLIAEPRTVIDAILTKYAPETIDGVEYLAEPPKEGIHRDDWPVLKGISILLDDLVDYWVDREPPRILFGHGQLLEGALFEILKIITTRGIERSTTLFYMIDTMLRKFTTLHAMILKKEVCDQDDAQWAIDFITPEISFLLDDIAYNDVDLRGGIEKFILGKIGDNKHLGHDSGKKTVTGRLKRLDVDKFVKECVGPQLIGERNVYISESFIRNYLRRTMVRCTAKEMRETYWFRWGNDYFILVDKDKEYIKRTHNGS